MKSLMLIALLIALVGCADSDSRGDVVKDSSLTDAGGVYIVDSLDAVFFERSSYNRAGFWRCYRYKDNKEIEEIYVRGKTNIFYDSSSKKIWIKRYDCENNTPPNELHVRTIRDLH